MDSGRTILLVGTNLTSYSNLLLSVVDFLPRVAVGLVDDDGVKGCVQES